MSDHPSVELSMMGLLIARADAACARYRSELNLANLHHRKADNLLRRLHVMEAMLARLKLDRSQCLKQTDH